MQRDVKPSRNLRKSREDYERSGGQESTADYKWKYSFLIFSYKGFKGFIKASEAAPAQVWNI